MAIISSCEFVNAGTFSSASQAALGNNSVVNLTQRVLAGTAISFTAPNTINLKPGSYIVNYFVMGDSTVIASNASFVGLRLNGTNINSSIIGSIPSLANPSSQVMPQAVGSYLITTNINSTLQLIAITSVGFGFPAVNAALTAVNCQTSQLTILKL